MVRNLPKNDPGIWTHLMRAGEFGEAWKISDGNLKRYKANASPDLPRHQQAIWNGSPLAGKRVLVRCYHGLGDTIQFVRYMPLLKSLVSEIIIWAQAPLLPLLSSVTEIDAFLELHDGTPEIHYDIDIEIMELPHIFRTTLETIPATVPYLFVPPMSLSKVDQGLNVGLVWKSGTWNEARSISFPQLAPLDGIKGINLFIMQQNAPCAGWEKGFGIHPGDFSLYEFARRLLSLDLLITVDSMPAHLAGALGVPVWTLLPAECDWRWMNHRADSPWYPTMQLFRQADPGNWDEVIERVASELALLVPLKTLL
jgi:hypothetical protein